MIRPVCFMVAPFHIWSLHLMLHVLFKIWFFSTCRLLTFSKIYFFLGIVHLVKMGYNGINRIEICRRYPASNGYWKTRRSHPTSMRLVCPILPCLGSPGNPSGRRCAMIVSIAFVWKEIFICYHQHFYKNTFAEKDQCAYVKRGFFLVARKPYKVLQMEFSVICSTSSQSAYWNFT